MKITKTEKIWLGAVILFYVCYNLPFVPGYGQARGTIVHALLTLIPLWVAIYVGLVKVCRIYRLRDEGGAEERAGADADKNLKSKRKRGDNGHAER